MAFSLFSFIKKIIFVSIFLCFTCAASATVVEGIYTTILEVQSQQASDRETAFNDALMDVLLKASGDREVLQDHAIISRLFPAEQYVVSFSYSENPAYIEYLKQIQQNKDLPQVLDSSKTEDAQLNQTDSLQTHAPQPYLIEVNFSEHALENGMRSSGIPIWGNIRPNILFWVVAEEDGKRQLMGQESSHSLLALLKSESARYALPIDFPVGDQTDNEAVDISNLWGLFPDAVDQASARYMADGRLMLRVYKSLANTWNANWYLAISGESYRSSVLDVDLETLSNRVVAQIAEVLVERFSIKSDQELTQGAVKMEVTDIVSFKDYVRLQKFLEKMTPVKSVTIDWVEADTVALTLQLNTNSEQFFEYLNLSGKLIKLMDTIDVHQAPAMAPGGILDQQYLFTPQSKRFKWQPSANDIKAK